MKNLAIFAACLLGMAACKNEAGYTITGNISGVEDGVAVYLENGIGGQFRFEGKAEEPFYAGISIQKKEGMFGGKVFNLFVENADIRVDGTWDKLYEAQITGSSLQDLCEAFEARLDTLYEQRNQLQAEMWGVYTGYLYEGGFTEACIAPGIEVEKKSRAITKQIEQACVDFIKAHPDSPVAIQAFKGLMGSMGSYIEQEVNDLLNLLAPNLKTTAAYAGLQERIQKADRLDALLAEERKVQQEVENIHQWADTIRRYLDLQELDREIVEELIDHIEIGERSVIDGQRHQDIKIFYRFVGMI